MFFASSGIQTAGLKLVLQESGPPHNGNLKSCFRQVPCIEIAGAARLDFCLQANVLTDRSSGDGAKCYKHLIKSEALREARCRSESFAGCGT